MPPSPRTRQLAGRAKAVLVFPNIVKAGFLFGAQYGEGALRVRGKTVGYYNTAAASYGLQAGVQAFGYALFFMSDSARDYLSKSGGFELGTGPSMRRPRRGHREGVHDNHGSERHLRVLLRSEGADGRARASGLEDQPDGKIVGPPRRNPARSPEATRSTGRWQYL